MADLTQTLGFDVGQALVALQQLDTQLASLEQKLNASATALTAFKTAAKGISAAYTKIGTSATSAATAIASFSTAAAAAANQAVPQTPANIAALLQTLTQAQAGIAGLTNAAGQAQAALQRFSNTSATNINRVKQSSDKLAVSFGTVVRVISTQLIVRAMSAIRGQLEDALSAAIEFETSLARIQTIGGPTAGSINQLATQVRALSEEFAQPIDDVAQGFYDILSNQIGGAADSALVLREALTLSRLAVSSTADAANALSSIINSYSLNASDAADISAKLFAAVDVGRFTLDEIANTIGRVTTLGAELGVGLDEVLASMATLTINGVKADEAMTLLSNAMRGLLKPTKAMKGAFNELNVASAEVGVATFGFQGFLEKLRETTNGTASEITQLTENIRVGRGVFGLTGDAAEQFAKNLDKIRDAGALGAGDKARLIIDTNAQQVKKELEELRNFFVVDFGVNALRVIKQTIDQFGGLVNVIKALRDSLLFVGSVVIGIKALATAVTLVRIATVALNGHLLLARNAVFALGASLTTLPGLAVITAITAAVIAYKRATEESVKTTQDLSSEIDESFNATRDTLAAQAKALTIEAKELQVIRETTVREAFKSQQQLVSDLQGLYKQDRDNAVAAQDEILENLQGQLKERLSLIEKVITQLERKQEEANATVAKNRAETQDLGLKGEERTIDRRIAKLNEQQKAVAQLARARQLEGQASAAAATSDFTGAEKLLQTADQRAQAALDLADKQLAEAKNTSEQFAAISQVSQAEFEVNQILQQRIALREQENKQALAQAAAAEKEASARRKQLTDAKKLVDQINNFEVIAKDTEKSIGDRNTARQAIVPLTQQLEQVLSRGNIGIEQFLGIQDFTRRIRADFDSALNGQPVPLTFAFQQGVDDIFTKLESRTIKLRAIVEELETSSGAKFDLKIGFDNIALGLVNKMDELLKGLNDQSSLPTERANLNTDAANAQKVASQLSFNTLVDSAQRQLLAQVNAGVDEALKGESERLLSLRDEFAEAAAEFNLRARAEGDTAARKGLDETARQFAELQLTIEQLLKRQVEIAAQVQAGPRIDKAIQDNLNRQDSAEGAQKILEFEQKQRDAIQKQTDLNKKVTDLGPAANLGATNASTALDGLQKEVLSTQRSVNSLAASLASLGSGPSLLSAAGSGLAALFNRGGRAIPYFDAGGMARGSDTMPAMLGADETVINAKSSRRFFSELQAINAGVTPNFGGGGSTTNNTNVGDIIVNGAQQPQVVAREVMSQIRREQRRGSKRLY